MIFSLIFLVLLVSGFLNALNVFIQHYFIWKMKKKIFCVWGDACELVLNSSLSKTFGVPNELIGLGYYTMLASVFAFYQVNTFLLSISLVAALFSVYLFYLQAFKLKQWCSWCLISIGINLLLFILVLVGYLV